MSDVQNQIFNQQSLKKQYQNIINDENESIVLLIDLDGTLIPVNIINKQLFALIMKPWNISLEAFEYLYGSFIMKYEVCQRHIHSHPEDLQTIIENTEFNNNIIDMIKTRKINCKVCEVNNSNAELNDLSIEIPKNKKVILVLSSGSTQPVVDLMVKYIEENTKIRFDHAFGSTSNIMNVGETKLKRLKEIMGDTKYSVMYLGDNIKADEDLAIFKQNGVIPMFVYEKSDPNGKPIGKMISDQLGKDILFLSSEYKKLSKK